MRPAPAGRDGLLFWLAVGFLLLLANSAVLTGFPSATPWYYTNVVVHPLLGVGLAWMAVVGRRRWGRRPMVVAATVLLTTTVGFGFALLAVGATRAQAWIVAGHVGAGVAGAALVLRGLWRTPVADPGLVRALVAGVVVIAAGSAAARAGWVANGHQGRIENPLVPPAQMEGEGAGPSSPFFPSSANTSVGGVIPANFFLTSRECGRCHTDIFEQWQSSAHRFSSFNNQWYRKSIEYMQDVVGTQPSKWCAGCHDHAVFFNGRFDRPIKEQIETPEAQAGLGCTSCHSIVHVGSTMGQGDFVVEYPALHDLALSPRPLLRRAHDALVYLAPEAHRRTFLKPFHREQLSEFCSSCHKVHLDVPVNGYRWIRGFNDYDNWQASGVSGQGARSFYYPATPSTCGSCHMPLVASRDPAAKNGMVRSHRFPGANTALPTANRDQVQLDVVQEFLRAGQISVDIFGLSRGNLPASTETDGAPAELVLSSSFATGEESGAFASRGRRMGPAAAVTAPIDRLPVVVRRGESVVIDVVVRNRKVGHFFPGGTVDAFDVWVEFEAVDSHGRVLRHSGDVADGRRGPVDPGAHFYRSLQLDEHGNPINKRNAWATRSVAYVRLIPPGAADTVHFRLDVPTDAGDRIELRAKVNHRKFTWWYTQWAYAGVRDPGVPSPSVGRSYDDGPWVFTGDTSKVSGAVKHIPDLPITMMAEAKASIAVVDATAPVPPPAAVLDDTTRERWNDFGIGLLLQGDLAGAEAAFRRVMTADPKYADGPLNVARVLVQEGDIRAALPLLEQSLALSPGLARTHYFMGIALKADGLYEEALRHLEAAAAQYPRDRVVLGQIGRVQFLQRRFAEAVASFQRVLAVDPEDLNAHYNLMLAYHGSGQTELAARERVLYERFKADEASQTITGPYRLRSPLDNRERQALHVH